MNTVFGPASESAISRILDQARNPPPPATENERLKDLLIRDNKFADDHQNYVMKEIQEKHDGIFSGLQDVGPVKVGVRPDQYLMQGEELKKRIQIHHYSSHPSNDHWLTSFASSDEPFRVKLYES
ncbi:MAG: hypothetical protein GY696_11785, partial [Gammaproteobacteria bacterium]|nr:hypothetical protein [Gammaproteobacteria bacterium]